MKIICPVCEVEIDGETVNYSYGKTKDKKHLYFKVCQHTKKNGCINDYGGDKKNDPYKFLEM